MTVSLGFAVADATTAVGYDQLREAAAESLKQAKDGGRNRSVARAIGPAPVP